MGLTVHSGLFDDYIYAARTRDGTAYDRHSSYVTQIQIPSSFFRRLSNRELLLATPPHSMRGNGTTLLAMASSLSDHAVTNRLTHAQNTHALRHQPNERAAGRHFLYISPISRLPASIAGLTELLSGLHDDTDVVGGSMPSRRLFFSHPDNSSQKTSITVLRLEAKVRVRLDN